MSNQLDVIISERRADDPAGRKLQQELARRLAEYPELRVAIVPHLYDVPSDGAAMHHLQQVTGDVVVFSWLYPRAAFWVLGANKVSGRMGGTSFFAEEELEPTASRDATGQTQRTIWCIDLRSRSRIEPYLEEVERILHATGRVATAEPQQAGVPRQVLEKTVYRWYPVIDYRRCAGCLECLNFCLFGVFGLDESQTLFVEQPDACRDGCPACSRICPSQAIMFPEHSDVRIAGDGHSPPGETPPRSPSAPDPLDRLVDGLDAMDP
jgi:NAD-dependent dihydropyrimidine dehydrogenase PreA subunit